MLQLLPLTGVVVPPDPKEPLLGRPVAAERFGHDQVDGLTGSSEVGAPHCPLVGGHVELVVPTVLLRLHRWQRLRAVGVDVDWLQAFVT